jgi:hypothetical protein
MHYPLLKQDDLFRNNSQIAEKKNYKVFYGSRDKDFTLTGI